MQGDGISIKSLSPDKHIVRWREGGRGSRARQETIYADYDDVVARKNRALAQMGKENQSVCTLAKLRTQYLKFCEHQKGYYDKTLVTKAILAKFGDVPITSLNTMLLEQYQGELLAKRKPATVNRYFACIKHMMGKAADWNLITEAQLKDVRKVKQLKENNRRLRYLSKEEAANLLDACRQSRAAAYLYPIVQVALNTGMRKGEIMGLRWDNIDLKAGFIHVTEDESMGQSIKNGEGRSIPINDTLRNVLGSLPVRIDGGRLFTTAFHGDCFVDALKRAKIRNFHFHDLRHTFASNLAMGGCDLATLKELLGHKAVSMTLRYSHLSGEHKKTAVKILDAPVNGMEAVGV